MPGTQPGESLIPDLTRVCGLARRMNCVPHLLVQGAKRSNVRARHLCTQLRVYKGSASPAQATRQHDLSSAHACDIRISMAEATSNGRSMEHSMSVG